MTGSSEVVVSLPDAAMVRRLSPAPAGVRFIEWDMLSPIPQPRPDLVVLPYMRQADRLAALAGLPGVIAQSQSLGYDGVADALPGGVTYCNAVGVHEASTAELALALVLAAQRGIPEFARAQPEHRWLPGTFPGLAGRSVLLVGTGGVGHEIESHLVPFDVELTRVARTARDGVHSTSELPELLPHADIVIVVVPLNTETTGLVDAAFLGSMRDGALLVNVGRGPLVDTDALLAELVAGRLRAALDVTDPEPLPAAHPLWDAPGLLISPHVGGNTAAMAPRMDRLIREQIARLLDGRPPLNVVLPAERAAG
ncbi:2-hydroxyacid dehydrogenase [soil metagenome]